MASPQILGDGTYWADVAVVNQEVSGGRQWTVGFSRPTGYPGGSFGIAVFDDGTWTTQDIGTGSASAYGYVEREYPASDAYATPPARLKALRIWVRPDSGHADSSVEPPPSAVNIGTGLWTEDTGASIMDAVLTGTDAVAPYIVEVFRYGDFNDLTLIGSTSAFHIPVYPDFKLDQVDVTSVEIEGTVADEPVDDGEGPPPTGEPTLSVDTDGDGVADYRVVKTPRLAGDPGSGYDIKIVDKDGRTVAVGFLPPGTDPNDPWTLRVDGRFLSVLYGGEAIVTYLIPEADWNLNPSTFWVGYSDTLSGVTGAPITPGRPPLGGFAYLLCTTFEERPLGLASPWLYSPNLYSEAIWESSGGAIKASRLPNQADLKDAVWGAKDGHTYPISHDLAERIWEANLSRFLTPAP